MEELTYDFMANIADRRSRGRSWESLAIEFACEADELRNATWRAPDYPNYYEMAEVTLLQECEAELLLVLRKQLRSTDEEIASKAASEMAKYLASKHRDHVRVQVETLRAKTVIAKAHRVNLDDPMFTPPPLPSTPNVRPANAYAKPQAASGEVKAQPHVAWCEVNEKSQVVEASVFNTKPDDSENDGDSESENEHEGNCECASENNNDRVHAVAATDNETNCEVEDEACEGEANTTHEAVENEVEDDVVEDEDDADDCVHAVTPNESPDTTTQCHSSLLHSRERSSHSTRVSEANPDTNH